MEYKTQKKHLFELQLKSENKIYRSKGTESYKLC